MPLDQCFLALLFETFFAGKQFWNIKRVNPNRRWYYAVRQQRNRVFRIRTCKKPRAEARSFPNSEEPFLDRFVFNQNSDNALLG